jgi:hypothetical protein
MFGMISPLAFKGGTLMAGILETYESDFRFHISAIFVYFVTVDGTDCGG